MAIFITCLISLAIALINLFLYRHSYDSYTLEGNKRIFLKEDKLTAPLWVYLLFALVIFIPGANIAVHGFFLLYLLWEILIEGMYTYIKLPKWLNWLKILSKRY